MHIPTSIQSHWRPAKLAIRRSTSLIVLASCAGKDSGDDFVAIKELHDLSGVSIPSAVDGLETAEIRHKTVVASSGMQAAVESYLGV